MGPHPVVIEPPVFDGFPRIVQGQEPVLVQALLTEFAVERFNIAVLHGPARGDEVQRHLILIRPLVQRLRRELSAVAPREGRIAGRKELEKAVSWAEGA